jgi:hypothetical protein
MSKTLTLRFQKEDQYDNMIFVASNESSNEGMRDAFAVLENYYKKLTCMIDLSSFLPIYCKDNYASIRFKKNYKHKNFIPNSVYDIDFEVRIVNRNNVKYCNCFITHTKLVKKATVIDRGELLTLD